MRLSLCLQIICFNTVHNFSAVFLIFIYSVEVIVIEQHKLLERDWLIWFIDCLLSLRS